MRLLIKINKNKYLYNGKEIQNDILSGTDFGLLDYVARLYDPAIGDWRNVDPLAEKHVAFSPYVYCANNPVKLIDPNGMAWIEGKDGVFWDPNTNSQEDFNKNYANKKGYTYVSDADNVNSYTLPSGAGSLVMNDWGGEGKIEEGIGSVDINLTFIPADGSAEVGWTQTVSSNIPDRIFIMLIAI